MKSEIKSTIDRIIRVLNANDASNWARPFENLKRDLDIDYYSTVYSLKSMFGGMGSFNDLVLHKDCVPLIKENNELSDLKDELYLLLEKAIESRK